MMLILNSRKSRCFTALTERWRTTVAESSGLDYFCNFITSSNGYATLEKIRLAEDENFLTAFKLGLRTMSSSLIWNLNRGSVYNANLFISPGSPWQIDLLAPIGTGGFLALHELAPRYFSWLSDIYGPAVVTCAGSNGKSLWDVALEQTPTMLDNLVYGSMPPPAQFLPKIMSLLRRKPELGKLCWSAVVSGADVNELAPPALAIDGAVSPLGMLLRIGVISSGLVSLCDLLLMAKSQVCASDRLLFPSELLSKLQLKGDLESIKSRVCGVHFRTIQQRQDHNSDKHEYTLRLNSDGSFSGTYFYNCADPRNWWTEKITLGGSWTLQEPQPDPKAPFLPVLLLKCAEKCRLSQAHLFHRSLHLPLIPVVGDFPTEHVYLLPISYERCKCPSIRRDALSSMCQTDFVFTPSRGPDT